MKGRKGDFRLLCWVIGPLCLKWSHLLTQETQRSRSEEQWVQLVLGQSGEWVQRLREKHHIEIQISVLPYPLPSEPPSQVALVVKNPAVNAEDVRDEGSVPGLRRSPRGGNGNPLQYSCLENPHRQRSQISYSPSGYSPSGRNELDMTE